MTENIVISGFEIELELELKPNQAPQKKKKRSLDNIDIENEYDLENNSEYINSVSVDRIYT